MATEKLIGKQLSFDERNYEKTLVVYKKMLPLVTNVAMTFANLGMGDCTNEIYQDLLHNNTGEIKKAYDKKIDEYILSLNMPLTSLKQDILRNADVEFNKLLTVVRTLKEEYHQMMYGGIGSYANTYTQLEKISIVNNQAEISKDVQSEIIKHYTQSIETENQATVYQLFLNLKSSFDKMSDFLKESGNKFDIITYMPSSNVLVYVDDDEHLQFIGQNIAGIN